jgi:hypothetical protein
LGIIQKVSYFSLSSEFLLSLSFVVDNMEKFKTNSDIHSISTRYRYNVHVPNTKLNKYERGVYYSEIKLYSNLPANIKNLNHKKFWEDLMHLLSLCKSFIRST